jgi:cell division GTPase FtsZ
MANDIREMKARIVVFGVGGAGGNAVNNMIAAGLQGVDFIVANTDAQALTMSKAERLIQMGTRVRKVSALARILKWGAPQPKRRSTRSAVL